MAPRHKPSPGAPAPSAAPQSVRFEATLVGASYAKALAVSAELALDRLPDVERSVRLLVDADDARRLLERGFEVHLRAAVPVAPLHASLVMSDERARASLEGRLESLRRKGGR